MQKHGVPAWTINVTVMDEEKEEKLESKNYSKSTVYTVPRKSDIYRSQYSELEISLCRESK